MRYYWLIIEKACAGTARALLWTAEIFGAMANAARAKKRGRNENTMP